MRAKCASRMRLSRFGDVCGDRRRLPVYRRKQDGRRCLHSSLLKIAIVRIGSDSSFDSQLRATVYRGKPHPPLLPL